MGLLVFWFVGWFVCLSLSCLVVWFLVACFGLFGRLFGWEVGLLVGVSVCSCNSTWHPPTGGVLSQKPIHTAAFMLEDREMF